MCECNPNIRSPWCGVGDCKMPVQVSKTDIRSPLAKARDSWLEANREKIDRWAIEANTNATYIENRLVSAFLDGAKAQEKFINETQ